LQAPNLPSNPPPFFFIRGLASSSRRHRACAAAPYPFPFHLPHPPFFQVDRGTQRIRANGLAKTARVVQGNFLQLPFGNAHFDAAYAIEATCHAPNPADVYGEIFRVLKPGGRFACYEWVMTSRFKPGDARHELIKRCIESGDGLPSLALPEDCARALEKVRWKDGGHWRRQRNAGGRGGIGELRRTMTERAMNVHTPPTFTPLRSALLSRKCAT